jgi:hypothetical protein
MPTRANQAANPGKSPIEALCKHQRRSEKHSGPRGILRLFASVNLSDQFGIKRRTDTKRVADVSVGVSKVPALSREAAAACSRGCQPTDRFITRKCEPRSGGSRDHCCRRFAAKFLLPPFSAGLHPQLCAAVASRLKSLKPQTLCVGIA